MSGKKPAEGSLDLNVVNKLLKTGLQNGASDIHFKVGDPPLYRVDGSLKELKFPSLTPEHTMTIAKAILADQMNNMKAEDIHEIDTSYSIPESGRFRVNIYRQRNSLAIVMRVIPFEIPSFADLHLPKVLKRICSEESGLILITGATGTGKSTTAASMIDYINSTKKKHILTIEEPIEFIFSNKTSSISQREVGKDTGSFAEALHAALRQDPDVLYVGEMRDFETVDVVMKAAETGHLVISTVHTPDSEKTIGRLSGYFPPGEQAMARIRLAENLKASVSQKLLPLKNGRGRVVACEVMVVNKTIEECIKDASKIGRIKEFIEKGKDNLKSQSFDQHLTELYQSGAISLEVAKSFATSPADFERNITFTT